MPKTKEGGYRQETLGSRVGGFLISLLAVAPFVFILDVVEGDDIDLFGLLDRK